MSHEELGKFENFLSRFTSNYYRSNSITKIIEIKKTTYKIIFYLNESISKKNRKPISFISLVKGRISGIILARGISVAINYRGRRLDEKRREREGGKKNRRETERERDDGQSRAAERVVRVVT